MPKDSRDVAITKFQSDIFKEYGYSDNGHKENIETVDDIIGKKAFGAKIVGVVDTNYSFELKDTANMTEAERREYERSWRSYIDLGVHNCLFLTKNYTTFTNNWFLREIFVKLNHDESDLVFLRINEDNSLGKSYFYVSGSYDWGSISKKEFMVMFAYIALGCIGLGIITSWILSIVSFKGKKQALSKMAKKEYDAKESVGLFAPEIFILVISALIINILIWISAAVLFTDMYGAEAPTYMYAEAAPLAIVAVLGEACVILAFAFAGVLMKIKSRFKPRHIDDIHY